MFLSLKPFRIRKFGSLPPLGSFPSSLCFSLHSSNVFAPLFLVNKTWKPLVPPRVKAFSWTVALNQINSMDILQRRRPYMLLSPNVLCKEERASHLLIHCSFSSGVWAYFLSRLNISWVMQMPNDILELFFLWNAYGFGERAKIFCGCLIHAIIWGIWKKRNRRIFEGKSKSRTEVIDYIIREVGGWIFVDKAFQGISLSSFV